MLLPNQFSVNGGLKCNMSEYGVTCAESSILASEFQSCRVNCLACDVCVSTAIPGAAKWSVFDHDHKVCTPQQQLYAVTSITLIMVTGLSEHLIPHSDIILHFKPHGLISGLTAGVEMQFAVNTLALQLPQPVALTWHLNTRYHFSYWTFCLK